MERTVPTTGSEEISLYMRTYYSLLRTTDEVQVRSFVESHLGMNSSLHVKARDMTPDPAALIYCSLRLPHCIRQTRLVVMGQSERVFARRGYAKVEQWEPVEAPGRRRRTFFDGQETMAAFIASVSDIDDLIPMLTAFQIEWNKMHRRLHRHPLLESLRLHRDTGEPTWQSLRDEVMRVLDISPDDMRRLESIWGEQLATLLWDMGREPKRIAVRLLAGSRVDYRKATRRWWSLITDASLVDLSERPVYFISSNVHSVVNMLSGFALRRDQDLLRHLRERGPQPLVEESSRIRHGETPSRLENLLYFILRSYMDVHRGEDIWQEREEEEALCGIKHIDSHHVFDVEAQVIEMCRLRPDWFDPRLQVSGLDRLAQSDAVIVNIDYPLGMGAYHILSQVATSVDSLRGVYTLGKAATLNGRIGDVMIPYVIHDEHSRNTYLFNNCFTAADVAPYLVHGTTLDNQKAISVRGTFLQNDRYMDVFYREGYTDIEMEAGPYLSAVYEAVRPTRHPTNEIVTLYADTLPFDVGIIHYASDTPLGKGRNLGAQRLSYFGVDSTYAATVAILRRILTLETRQRQGND
ncbi:MAG: hypothetical protein PVJ55_01015 [Anaerolineae bacterium]|jgi:hypothetical protein